MSGENTFKISVMNSSVHTYSCPLIGVVFWSVGRVKRKTPVESSASCHIDERWEWQRDTDRRKRHEGNNNNEQTSLSIFFLAAEIDINSHKHNTDTLSSEMSQEKYFFCINTNRLIKRVTAPYLSLFTATWPGLLEFVSLMSDVSQTAVWSVAGVNDLEQGCSILLLGCRL